MGKINNKIKYPLKSSVQLSDYLIGTDGKSLDLKTVNFTIQSIIDFIRNDIIKDSFITFKYLNNVPNNLDVQDDYPFKLLKTLDGKYYFVLNEELNEGKIYIKDLDTNFTLNGANKHPLKKAWKLEIINENFINENLYLFSISYKGSLTNITILIEGNPFTLIKNPLNINLFVENGDMAVNGWRNNRVFESALLYVDGDSKLFDSWESVGQVVEINQ